MNKIYEVIWNKVRNCYVVVSEIAKRNSKGSAVTDCRRRFSSVLAAMVLASLLNLGVAAPVWAASEIHYIGINAAGSHENYDGEGASGTEAIAIGADSSAGGTSSIAIGFNADVDEYYGAIAIGGDSSATGNHSLAIGYKAVADGIDAIAIGKSAASHGKNAVAFAGGNESYGDYSMSWGFNNVAGKDAEGNVVGFATAFGSANKARGIGSIAAGSNNIAEGLEAVALGNNTYAGGDGSFSVGQYTQSVGHGSFSSGIDSVAYGDTSVAQGATAMAMADDAVAIGYNAISAGDSAVAMGIYSEAYGDRSVALAGAKTGKGTVEFDQDTHEEKINIESNAYGAVAIGNAAHAVKDYGVAAGHRAKAMETDSVAIGNEAVSTKSSALAIGNQSIANEDNVVSVGHKATDKDYSGAEFGTELKRRIINVAEGTDDTDAVNVSQLKELKNEVSNKTAYFSVNSTETPNRDGKGATGVDAMAIGDGASASGNSSAALGDYADAKGLRSIALGNSAGAEKDYGIAIGGLAKAKAEGGIAVGTSANVTGANAVALGNSSKAEGATSYAIGQGANAKGESSVALGTSTESAVTGVAVGHMAKATGESGVAVGTATTAGKTAIAIGHGANASVEASTAIGINASATANHAVALGTGSVASEANTVSVGNTETKRRIVNVADGTSATDAATVGQTVEMVDGVNTKIVSDGKNAIGQNKVKVNVEGLGQVVADDTGLVNGGTMHTELRPTDGTYVKKANTTAANLKALDTQVKTNTDDIADLKDLSNITDDGKDVIKTNAKSAINVIGTGKATVNKTDVSGVDTYTVSVTADGTVTSGNTDIVNGGTVYNALHSQKEEIDTALDGKANTGLDNITDGGKTVVRDLAKEAVKVVDGTNTTVTEGTDGNAKTYAVNVTTDGQVVQNNEGVVSGGTMFSELRPADGNYIAKANTTAQNLTALDTKVKTNTDDISDLKDLSNITDAGKTVVKDLAKGSVNVIGSGKATVMKSDVNGVDTYNVEVKADGVVASGDNNIVTGGTVHDALQAQKDEINTALDGKANVGLDNITDNGKTVVRTLAQEAVKVVDGTKTTVTEGTDGNAKTYAVNVTVDGAVSSGNDGIVSGGTVYNAIQNAVSEIESGTSTALANKANISLDNVNEAGHNVIKTDAKSAINVAEGDHVAVAKTNVNGVDTYTVSVKTDGQVAQNDGNVVSGGTVHKALQDEREITNTSLEGKSNVALDNITEAGHNVIKEDAKSAINVKGGTYATVDKTNVNGVDTYTVNVANDGSVAEGNDKLVTGGTVYEALNTVISDTNTALDGKANTGLDNITDNGKTVVRDLAKESVKVVDGTHTTVTEGTEGNAKTYAVNVTTDGRVAQNNEGIVSGGTVYEALQAERGTTDTALETKANVALDNVTDAGHTVIKADAKAAINVTGGTYATVDKTDVNGVDTYTVHVATDGSVVAGNEKLVTGGTVYDALIAETRPATDGNYIVAGNPAGQNLTALDTQVKTNTDAIDAHTKDITKLKDLSNITDAGKNVIKTNAKEAITVTGSGKATVTKTDVSGVDTYNVEVLANGTVTDGNENIVSGGTVYTAIQDAISASEEGTTTALGRKANVSLDNLTEDGHSMIKTDAKSAITVVGGNYATVDKTDIDGVDTYIVNVATDGAVTEGNTKLVTGGTVYTAINNEKTQREDADTALGNRIDGETTARENADTALSDRIGTLSADGNYIRKADSVSQNLVALDTQVKTNTDTVAGHTTDIAGLKDLSNITEAGEEVIREKAKMAIRVTGEGLAQVNKTVENNTDVYTVKVEADGTVSADDTKAVSGNAVHEALQNEKDRVNRALDTKANTELSNLSDAGKSAVRTLAKESVAVIAGDNVSVTTEDVGELRNYKVSALSNGTITAGDTGLLSGNTVFDEVRITTDGTYVFKDKSTAQNIKALDKAVRDIESGIGGISVKYDNVNKETVTLEGANGTKITNVSDGAVTESSTDAVNGRQLYQVDKKVDTVSSQVDAVKSQIGTAEDGNYISSGNTVNQNLTALDNKVKSVSDETESLRTDKADKDLGNLTDAGKETVRDLAKGAVSVKGAGYATVTKTEEAGKDIYTVEVKADGQVAQNNTGIVTGGAVYDALQQQAQETDTKLDTKANADASNVTNATAWGEKIATGAVAKDEVRAVSGDTVYKAIQDVSENVDRNKANVSLDNLNDAGKDTVRTLAKESVAVEGQGEIKVTSRDEGNTRIYTASIDPKGKVEAGNTGVVTGGTVHDALQPVKEKLDTKADATLGNITEEGKSVIRETMKEDLKKKADVNAGNIDTQAWADKLGTGQVEAGDNSLVKGGTVYEALRNIDGNNIVRYKDGTVYVGASQGGNYVDIRNASGEGRVITGVATNPSDGSSAANVAYVDAVAGNLADGVSRGFDQMNTRINRVGANAAAMASLAPVAMEEDQKWNVAAAFGNYRNETAGAVGVFFKPQDNIMVNLRTSLGSSSRENMIGGGISFALDKLPSNGMTKKAMTEHIRKQDEKIAQLEKLVTELATKVDAQNSK